jgi:phosphatidylserine decarboxylase
MIQRQMVIPIIPTILTHSEHIMHAHQNITNELIALLNDQPSLQEALLASFKRANFSDIQSLKDYFDFLDATVTLIPNVRNLNPVVSKFYFIIGQSPDHVLRNHEAFQEWVRKFASDWGTFLDTVESAASLQSFYTDPSYHMDDYIKTPGGWFSFNQFFARQVKPGKRPIDGLCDDHSVVSPADSVYQGAWKIAEDSTITIKDLRWSVLDLLAGSPYQERFKNGLFTHSFLDVNDYHRFHLPIAGVVKELRKIPGHAVMDVIRNPDGSLSIIDGVGYQFTQDRGLIIIETAIGMVAVLPIGMAQVSSVNLTPDLGASLHKGEEFGYFAFGGSDIITLYESDKVELTARVGQHYLQGQQLGHVRHID